MPVQNAVAKLEDSGTKRDGADTPLPQEETPRARSDWVFVGLFALAALYSFHFARPLLLPVVLAVLFSLLLSPVVGWLGKFHLPEPVSAAIVVAILLACIGAAFTTSPSLPRSGWTRRRRAWERPTPSCAGSNSRLPTCSAPPTR